MPRQPQVHQNDQEREQEQPQPQPQRRLQERERGREQERERDRQWHRDRQHAHCLSEALTHCFAKHRIKNELTREVVTTLMPQPLTTLEPSEGQVGYAQMSGVPRGSGRQSNAQSNAQSNYQSNSQSNVPAAMWLGARIWSGARRSFSPVSVCCILTLTLTQLENKTNLY